MRGLLGPQPPSPDDYSGALQSYEILLGRGHEQEVTCPAALTRCALQVPAELRALSVSAVTSYGTSPSADVPLGRSGDDGPVLRVSALSADGSSVFASWSGGEPPSSTSGGEPLHSVLEWTAVPGAELQWQKVALDQNCTFIRGTLSLFIPLSLYLSFFLSLSHNHK
ncbi:hypothetical protein EYF80_043252 [Liparis tanakae]|uniref:Uncharacterized protein n=1 Tax=Liparis tanakae TaxID=230148 RepID=A0A4Z2G046_9TELE|nr:hypothetical protein EYF80_043252 [Liparis tanakae]